MLGANEGIVSTASLMIGIAVAAASQRTVLIASVAGLTAGALSMAVGEYVSVSFQRATEEAGVRRERAEIAAILESELQELASIDQKRGLDRDLAMNVARQLSAADVLGAHSRDELCHLRASRACPLRAALVSAASFAIAVCLPILALGLASSGLRIPFIGGSDLCRLGILGEAGGHPGGVPRVRERRSGSSSAGAWPWRITALVGRLFGVVGP